jgi:surfactin synthase thioesterase subunit
MSTNGCLWLNTQSLNSGSALRLFCLPYAGGNSTIFRGWQQAMPDGVEVCPIHLPGRGSRFQEPSLKRIDAIVQNLAPALVPHLSRPFAIFGHSMGALIAFELARHLRSSYSLEPARLFVSAWRSPEIAIARKEYELPDEQFISVLRRFNGTPDEILENAEALELLLPILRADFEVTQTYVYRADTPLDCPIRAFAGLNDLSPTAALMRPWKQHTTSSFSMSILPGDHFFITTSRSQLLTIIAHDLGRALEKSGRGA